MKNVISARGHRFGLISAIGATVILVTTAAVTLGGFSAVIDNNSSTFSSGNITPQISVRESNGTTTCNSGTNGTNTSCAINALTGTLDQTPGGTPLTSTITLSNTGSDNPGSTTLTTGTCTAGAASDASGSQGSDTPGFCGKVDVTIANTTSGATDKCVYPAQSAACPTLSSSYTLAGLAGTTFNALPLSIPTSSSPATYVVSVQLDSSANNADQELAATLPFTWSISA
jgi:hypothetical protein